MTDHDDPFDYPERFRRFHTGLTLVDERTTHAESHLVETLTAVIDSGESWEYHARLDKVEDEIDDAIELLTELKTDVDDFRDAGPDRDKDLPTDP